MKLRIISLLQRALYVVLFRNLPSLFAAPLQGSKLSLDLTLSVKNSSDVIAKATAVVSLNTSGGSESDQAQSFDSIRHNSPSASSVALPEVNKLDLLQSTGAAEHIQKNRLKVPSFIGKCNHFID